MRIKEILEDMSRRGFLKGMVGTAAVAATDNAFGKAPSNTINVVVKPGDTVYSISRQYNVTPQELFKLNHMNNTTKLEKGQTIKIPKPATPVKAAAPKPGDKGYVPPGYDPNKPGSGIYADPADKGLERPTKSIKSTEPTKTVSTQQQKTIPHGGNALQEPGFRQKLQQVANALGVETRVLLGIMKHETGNTLSPQAKAPGKHGAVGLIQFIPKTARELGTSTEALAKMSATQQLDYVYRFYKSVGVKPGMDIGDMYMCTFMPAYVHKPVDTIIGKKNGGTLPGTDQNMHAIWVGNPAFSNEHKKPYFTIRDIKNRIEQWL
jgi:LysM repeat protein